MKRIIICSDGTWNKPERNLKKDNPTNVLKLARAVDTQDDNGIVQTVFYDWGVGSYYDPVGGGITGKGLQKNIEDCYRFIVHNYEDDDQIFLFGFSRGAYTVRALSGLINNCGILTKNEAHRIIEAMAFYKKTGAQYKPSSKKAQTFRSSYSHQSREVFFIGVWDTVGAMGIPLSIAELFDTKEEFHDRVIGKNVQKARHALAIDEVRNDFEPTIWVPNERTDLTQKWFCGVHSDIGGGYAPDKSDDQRLLTSLHPLNWISDEAALMGLSLNPHWLVKPYADKVSKLNNSYTLKYKARGKHIRPIDHGQGQVNIDASVSFRWLNEIKYRPKNLVAYSNQFPWP